jgi:hypothetical protein
MSNEIVRLYTQLGGVRRLAMVVRLRASFDSFAVYAPF